VSSRRIGNASNKKTKDEEKTEDEKKDNDQD
jgi:hypothetical protein